MFAYLLIAVSAILTFAVSPSPRTTADCYTEVTKGGDEVTFCVKDTFCEGVCAGGVFKGMFVCKQLDWICKRKYGFPSYTPVEAVIKFNEVGSEVVRPGPRPGFYIPASNTDDEVDALSKLQSLPETVRLYGIIGQKGRKRFLGGRTFWEPGMVMELLKQPTVGDSLDDLYRKKAGVSKLASFGKCIIGKLIAFGEKMMKTRRFHIDMHSGNVFIKDSADPNCPDITVIDFGVLYTLTPTLNDPKKVLALAELARRVDELTQDLEDMIRGWRLSSGVKDQSFLRTELSPSLEHRQFLTKVIAATTMDIFLKEDISMICRNTIHSSFSYCNLIHRLIKIKEEFGSLAQTEKQLDSIDWTPSRSVGRQDSIVTLTPAPAREVFMDVTKKHSLPDTYVGEIESSNAHDRRITRPVMVKMREFHPQSFAADQTSKKRGEVSIKSLSADQELEMLAKAKGVSRVIKLIMPLLEPSSADIVRVSGRQFLFPGFVLSGSGEALTQYAEVSSSKKEFYADQACVITAVFFAAIDLVNVDVLQNFIRPEAILIDKDTVVDGCPKVLLADFQYAIEAPDNAEALASICADIDSLINWFSTKTIHVSPIPSRVIQLVKKFRQDFGFMNFQASVERNCNGSQSKLGSCCHTLIQRVP